MMKAKCCNLNTYLLESNFVTLAGIEPAAP